MDLNQISRRDFLRYTCVGTFFMPLLSEANPLLIWRGLSIWGRSSFKEGAKHLSKIAKKNNNKRKTHNKIVYYTKREMENYISDELASSLIKNINRKQQRVSSDFISYYIKNNLSEKNISAIWDIDCKKNADITFTNPSYNNIETPILFAVKDLNTGKIESLEKKFYLKAKANSSASFSISFNEYENVGFKKIIAYGNKQASNLKISNSGIILSQRIII